MSRVFDYSELSKSQMIKLKEKIENEGISVTSIPILKRTGIGDAVTSLQERVWLLSSIENNSATYNLSSAFHMQWKVDPHKLKKSIQYVIHKYDSLRAVFRIHDGELRRYECEKSDTVLEVIHVKEKSMDDLKALISKESKRNFVLDKGPLYHFTLYQRDDDDFVLHMVIHHMVADGISLRIITDDIIQNYEGIQQVEHPFQELGFMDYVQWCKEWICPNLVKKELHYWKENLKGYSGLCMIKPENTEDVNNEYSGSSIKYTIKDEKHQNIKYYIKQVKKTPFIIFLSAFKVLAHRYIQEEDIVIGVPDEGRYRIELEQMVGALVNTLIMRDKITGEISWGEILDRTEQIFLSAKKNSIIPLELIANSLKISKGSIHDGLFQMFFIFHNCVSDIVLTDGRKIEIVDIDSQVAKYHLTLEIFEYKDRYDIKLEYRNNIYSNEFMKGFMESFINILTTVSMQDNLLISEIPILNQKKELLITNTWNATQRWFDKEKSLYELIEQKCREMPYKTAVITEEKEYSYEELIEESKKLSNILITYGLRPGDRVGIQMENSIELIISILALLRIYVAYVPLDPTLPEKRSFYIQNHAEISLILAKKEYAVEIANDFRTLYVDSLLDEIELEIDVDTCIPGGNGDMPAYIMYTSGSTGNPKGVQISHNNVVNFLYGMEKVLGFAKDDSIPLMTTYSFDISVLEIFLPLFTGGSILLIPPDIRSDMNQLIRILNERKPTFVQATPSFWKVLMESRYKPDGHTTALTGGEAVDQETADMLIYSFDKVFNMYGPTETTVWSSVHLMMPNTPINIIGKPIFNTEMYILDSYKKPVPPGVEGDLYIGGEGVSCGYYNNDDETKNRFILSPLLNNDKQKKLFFTGDRAKYNHEGQILFYGRSDYQLKIRGYRMEAHEIETKLDSCGAIEKSIVLGIKDGKGDTALVAYIRKKDCFSEEQAEVIGREYLAIELPNYMIPTYFIFVEEFPLTYNLKIDRKSLQNRKLEFNTNQIIIRKSEKMDEITEKIKKIWCDVLQKSDIQLDDDFFDLGGHSLQAIRVSFEVEKEFCIHIPVKWIVKHTKFQDFCGLVKENRISKDYVPVEHNTIIEQPEEERYHPFPLTDVQRAYWIGRHSEKLGNISTHIYREMEIEKLNIDKLEEALNKVINRHDMLRAVFKEDGTQIVMKNVPLYTINTIDYEQSSIEEQKYGLGKTRNSLSHQIFDPYKWPLFDIKVSLLPEKKYRIHFSFDCLIGDAKSVQLIFSDLSDAYIGMDFIPESIDYSFRSFVMYQRQQANTDRYYADRDYWRNRIENMPEKPAFTLSCSSDNIRKPHFKRYKKVLSKEVWKSISEEARKRKITKTSFMLTCFTDVLKLWCDSPEFLINITLFNRTLIHPHIQYIVGDFTSVCLFESKKFGDMPFKGRAEDNQIILLETLEHSLYNGICVTKDLITAGIIDESIPVVFTSLLDDDFKQEENSFVFVNTDETVEYDITQTPQVWLDHQLFEYNGELHLIWDVVEELFDLNMIEDMFETYFSYLSSFDCTDAWEVYTQIETNNVPSCKNKRISCEIIEDKQSLLFEGFIQQAKQNPNKMAILSEDGNVSYESLDILSDRLALRLLDICSEEKNIAVIMGKGWEEIAAILAILKAGKVYVPIQADLPEERINKLLGYCEIKTALVQSNSKVLRNNNNCVKIEEVSNILDCISLTEEEKLKLKTNYKNLAPNSIAYMIYTSGSTGVPKAVIMTHSAAWNTISDINERYKVNDRDCVLCLSSTCFDLSVYDIFGLLSVGGTLVIPRNEEVKSPSDWYRYMNEHKVTIWNSVPALMKMLINYLDKTDQLETLRLVLLSGDWIPVELPEQIKGKNRSIKVISLGGATECAIWSVIYEVGQIEKDWVSIPYGKALKNQWIGVLNKQFQICPYGVEGDIYIGGAGLSLGYYKDIDRTHEQFIYHPTTGERIYKTGDRGKYAADENIIFLGREDSQIKLNGYRIELGEIEAAIKQVSGVAQAVVTFEDSTSDKKIKAYYVPERLDVGISEAGLNKIRFKMENKGMRNEEFSHKKYALPKPASPQKLFYERRSYRNYSSETIPLSIFSSWLLSVSAREYENMPFYKRIYASAGGLYPVQIYLGIKKNAVEGIEEGFYYYHPFMHELKLIQGGEGPSGQIHVESNLEIYNNATFTVFFVTDMQAIEPIYGEQSSFIYSLLEAGMMTQLLEMKGAELGLGFCQIGALHDEKLKDILQLKDDMRYIHCILGGPIEERQMTLENMVLDISSYAEGIKQNSMDIINEIEKCLSSNLPKYMIPKSITKLDEIPLTSNGKIDYRKLSNISNEENLSTKKADGIPWNTLEKDIADIWKNVLQIESVNPDENFFDIGGNSFNIILVQKEIKKLCGQEIPVLDLFRHSSVFALAKYIVQKDSNHVQILPEIHLGERGKKRRNRRTERINIKEEERGAYDEQYGITGRYNK